jgi:HK97 family phage prohead protease
MPLDLMFAAMRGVEANPRVGRDEALSVPTVQRGRNLLCSISSLPIKQLDESNNQVANPLFKQIDPDVPNVVTLAQTVEDLVFESVAWWKILEADRDGFPTKCQRLDPDIVSLHPPGGHSPSPLPAGEDPRGAVVWVDGKKVSASEIIRFDSPNPAVLKVGGRAIKRAILLDQMARLYADDPRPLDYFTPADNAEELTPEETAEFLDKWRSARKARSTAFIPASVKYNTVEQPTPADLQLVELQQQAALDVANAMGLDPEELGVSTTSRTYANAVDRRIDKINDVKSPYMRAITDRLSMGDVTRPGHRVVLDLDDYMKSNPTERVAYYKAMKEMGVMDDTDIREAEGLPARSGPAPAAVEASDETVTETFDQAPKLTFVDAGTEEFSVDKGKRIIEGLILPYGKSAKGFRFEQGSVRWSDVSRVKLLRDHDFKQPLGVAESITETARGLKARFKVARGPEGDRALELAEDRVLDGLSVGVDFDFDADTIPDPRNKLGRLVRRGDLKETSLTPMPAFDDARVTRVAASLTEGTNMTESVNGQTPEAGTATTPEAPAVTLSADQFAELMKFAAQGKPAASEDEQPAEQPQRQVVNPTRLNASVTSEPLPYRFDRGNRFVQSDHEFSADIRDMLRAGDQYGQDTDAGKRVMGLIKARFTVESGDVNELNPAIQRPDMYVDQVDYRTPLWDFVNKGAPPNGVQPFTFPKYSSSSGLVQDHTEGTEPTSGNFVTTSQTVTPTALSGKASIPREVWAMGGNPAVSNLVYNQMVRGWREGLETASGTFLNTLTAATDITLAAGSADDVLAAAWDAALAELQFARGYDFEAFALEKELYKKFVAAVDGNGRKLYAQINPTDANGRAASRFVTLDLGGVTGVPSHALASTAGSPNNSWLFDPKTVHGWASAPERLEFAGTDASGGYAPVAMVDIAIFGYKAFANTDIGGVRQVIYDTTA